QIERGQHLTELLKQPQYQPMGIWEQVVSIYAVSEGAFDEVITSKIKPAQSALLSRLWSDHKDAMRELNIGDKMTEKTEKVIKTVAEKVAKGFEE
ncbi:MAG: F0F1 ATP synthase subunit alpha, partial [Candidatus Saccharimonadaceae bacterium]